MTKSINYKLIFVATLLVVLTMLVSVSCSTTKTSDQTLVKNRLEELRATKLYKEAEIKIGDNYFSPKSLTIEPNTIVIFTNKGISLHDVLSDDIDMTVSKTIDEPENIMSSDVLKSKDIYVVLFTEEGEYGYHCHFHGGPKFGQFGTITVEAKK